MQCNAPPSPIAVLPSWFSPFAFLFIVPVPKLPQRPRVLVCLKICLHGGVDDFPLTCFMVCEFYPFPFLCGCRFRGHHCHGMQVAKKIIYARLIKAVRRRYDNDNVRICFTEDFFRHCRRACVDRHTDYLLPLPLLVCTAADA
jgi:hypothetical protein